MLHVRKGITTLIGAVILFYPVFVYFGLQTFQVGGMLIFLGALLLVRLVLSGGVNSLAGMSAGVGSGFCVLGWLFGGDAWLLFYPAVMNGFLLLIFAVSVLKPPTVIERLAKLSQPELPASGIRYTRNVTLVWCVFFLLNGGIACVTAVKGDLALWTLFNGLISYVGMAILFCMEWLVRQRVLGRA